MYLHKMNFYRYTYGWYNTLFDNYLQYMHRTKNTSILIYYGIVIFFYHRSNSYLFNSLAKK